MSQSLSRGQALRLGVVVMAALLLGGAALLFVQQRTGFGGSSVRVQAGFPDIRGVEAGTRVRFQGIDVGEVEAILPPEQPGQPVQLRLRVAGRFHHLVRADAKVEIASESLLAGKILRIIPGSSQAELVADGAVLTGQAQPDLLEGITQAATKLNAMLADIDAALASLRSDNGSITQDLAQAATKLNRVLTKADDALASIEKGEGTLGKLVKNETLYNEMSDAVTQVKAALYEMRSGEGTLGKLLKNNDAYAEALASLQDVRRMVNSVKQNSDAIKALPLVRNYVVDPAKELIRPECKRLRRVFAEKELFESGKAVLTAAGRKRLDETGAWLVENKDPASEVLVAAFAEPTQPGDYAYALTKKQGEVVADYLRSQHSAHRTGWFWWNTRSLRSLGVGNAPTPVPESEKLPAARVEVIVFLPQ